MNSGRTIYENLKRAKKISATRVSKCKEARFSFSEGTVFCNLKRREWTVRTGGKDTVWTTAIGRRMDVTKCKARLLLKRTICGL